MTWQFVLAGGLSLMLLGKQRALRTLVLDRGVLSAPIARLAPAPKRTQIEIATAQKAALPPGPRLGGTCESTSDPAARMLPE